MSTGERPLRSEVSEDGSSWTVETTLGAPGVHDPEKQLSPEQVVALKEKLKSDDDAFYDLPARVCTHIVMEMLLESVEDSRRLKAEAEERGESFESSYLNQTREEFAEHVGFLTAHWTWGLRKAVDMPGSEWPQGMTPPATFAEAIKELEELEAKDSEAKYDDQSG